MKPLTPFFVYGLLSMWMMMMGQISALSQYPSLKYENKKYYIHEDIYTTYQAALDNCTADGGILAEINDEAEFRSLQNYLNKEVNDDKTHIVMIGGTDMDKDGEWYLPSTGEILPYENWLLPEFTQDYDPPENKCLSLVYYDWSMFTYPCEEDPPASRKRFMCEIEIE